MTDTADNNAVAVLLTAADRIRFGGLAKKMLQDGESFCVIGALCYAQDFRAAGVALDAVRAELGLAGLAALRVPDWNNAPDRTADEVVDVLMRAAKRLANTA